MGYGTNDGKDGAIGPDKLALACGKATILAPGGMFLGYVAGRLVARALSHCPFVGPCGDITPLLVSLSSAVLGLGVGNTLATLRVRYWWEAVTVWAVGIVVSLIAVALVGFLGALSATGLLVAGAWMTAAVLLAVAGIRRSSRSKAEAQSKR